LQGLVYSARDRTEVKALYHLGTVLVRSNWFRSRRPPRERRTMEELYCARPTLQTPAAARAAHLSTAPLALLSAVARCTTHSMCHLQPERCACTSSSWSAARARKHMRTPSLRF